MRILYLSPWFPYPLDTGSRIRVYHLLRALAQRHRVTLLTLNPSGWAPPQVDAVAPLCEHVQIVHRDPFRHGWLRRATRFFSFGPIMAAPFPELERMARQLHAKDAFDAVISATVVMTPYALASPGTVRVLEEHNSHTRWMHERYQTQRSSLRRLQCWVSWRKSALFESRLFRRFDLVSMVSEQDAEIARKLVGDSGPPVDVFLNGVDVQTFRVGSGDPRPDTLVFSGSLTYDANYEAMQFFLREVYPTIRAHCPGIRLRITGSLKGVDLAGLSLDESVTLTGFVEDVRTEVAGAWVSVVPLLSGGGTRLKILEAMALGTPVVSTTKGTEGLGVTPGQEILIADRPDEFARATVRLLEDAALRGRIARSARSLVERSCDWEQIGRRFVERIEVLVEGIDRQRRER